MEKRTVYTKIWRDSWFIELSRTAKILFLYCITNSSIGFSGYFECPDRVICFDTGLTTNELLEAKEQLRTKVVFAGGWVFVKNAEKLDPIRGDDNPLWKAYNKELAQLPTFIKQQLNAIQQEQKDPTKGLPRGYEAPHGSGNGIGNKKGGVGENKFRSIDTVTPAIITEIASQYSVSIHSVNKELESMRLYCQSYGKTYKDYRATLQNWVRRKIDEGKIKRISTAMTSGVAGSVLEEKERQYANNS